MEYNLTDSILLFCRTFEQQIKKEAAKVGVLESFFPILQYVSLHEGTSQLEIAYATGYCPPTICVTLKKMEQRGLINRTSRKGSGRTVRVTLTDEGREKHDFINRVIARTRAACLDGLSEEKQRAIASDMQKMTLSLKNA